jgi:hypothetical protein
MHLQLLILRRRPAARRAIIAFDARYAEPAASPANRDAVERTACAFE